MEDIYITEVECINWESHRHSRVRLTPGINGFIGSSDSGKSSILRAIRWSLKNDESGVDFITEGETDTTVSVSLSNGVKVKRRKTRSGDVNTYELFRDGVPLLEHPLTGFGTKVPREVEEASEMGDFRFLFAPQLEGPFLISATPKYRADTIGNLEELKRVDDALQSTNQDIHTDAKMKRELDKEITKQEKEIEQLRKRIAKSEPKMQTLSSLKKHLVAETQLLQKLEGYHHRLGEIEQSLQEQQLIVQKSDRILAHWDDTLPDQVALCGRLEQALSRLLEIETELNSITFMSESSLQQLLSIVAEAEQSIHTLQRLSAAKERLEEIDSEKKRISSGYSSRVASIDFAPAEADITVIRTLQRHMSRLTEIEQEVGNAQNQVEDARKQIDALLNQFVESLQTAQICPTCAQSTANVSCDHIQAII